MTHKAAYEALAGHKKTSKHKVKKMNITKADSGGYVIHHPETDEQHVAPDTDALHDHIEQAMGEPNAGEQTEPDQQAESEQAAA